MILKKQLLNQDNLNNAYLSKTTSTAQSIASTLAISGGIMTLKNTVLTDNASTGYLRIDPQGNAVVIYDGVNNQQFSIYSSSGTEAIQLTTINGAPSYSLIDITAAVDHLEIMTSSLKPVVFGGNITGKRIDYGATTTKGALSYGGTSVTLEATTTNTSIQIKPTGTGTLQLNPLLSTAVTTKNNTLDDGVGNATITGTMIVATATANNHAVTKLQLDTAINNNLTTVNHIYTTTTAGQTTFSIGGGYTVGLINMYMNGVRLQNGNDFTATDGLNVVLTSSVTAGQDIEFEILRYAGVLPNVTAVNGRTGNVIISSLDVTTALGYTPADKVNTNDLEVMIWMGAI